MASFAKLDGNNIVVTTVSLHNNEAPTEQAGVDFLNILYGTSDVWKQTSYNTYGGVHYETGSYNTPSGDQSKAFRKNHPSKGYTYDPANDAFIAPQPFPSWILNPTSFLWEAPVAYPNDHIPHWWNESTGQWEDLE